jgi:hypothetical protein
MNPTRETLPCPSCGAPDGHVLLLTSWVRYVTCERCGHRWQLPAPVDAGALALVEDESVTRR